MKLCDRCPCSGGCLLNYLGKACRDLRKKEYPDVQPNRAELIANMDSDEMARKLLPMLMELCEDGIPSQQYMKSWLESVPGKDEF